MPTSRLAVVAQTGHGGTGAAVGNTGGTGESLNAASPMLVSLSLNVPADACKHGALGRR